MDKRILSDYELLELTRWNLPTIYNAWEKISKRNRLECNLNWEEVIDFAPQLGTVAGYAVTMEYTCASEKEQKDNPGNWAEFIRYVADAPGPKIVLTRDLDAPNTKGSFFGEVMSNIYRSLGCVAGISDGTARDVDESNRVGFKLMAKRLFVGHGYSHPVRWGKEIEIYGTKVTPGHLILADKYGFMAVPPEEQKGLLEASRYLDSCELKSMISTSQAAIGLSMKEKAEAIIESQKLMGQLAAKCPGK